jgi:hypothetical protein
MNKEQMKRKHIEEVNIMMEKRANEPQIKVEVKRDTTRKDNLKEKLMNQLKYGK